MKNISARASNIASHFCVDMQSKMHDIEKVENETGVNLSREFKKLYQIIPYDLLGSSMSYGFPLGVIEETLSLRKIRHLPLNTLFLSEESESVHFMKCLGDHEEIYWISYEDAHNYCEGKPLIDNPIVYPTFTDFFQHRLTEEEKARGIISL